MSVHEQFFVDVRGKKTQVTQGGTGPDVVYLHSAMGDADWLPHLDSLAERGFRVTVPAHPGFAESGGLELIDDLDDLVFHYLDLFAELEVERPHLVGLSLGGWYAAEMAVRYPNVVDRLVLTDAAGLYVEGHSIKELFGTPPNELAPMVFHDLNHPMAMMMLAMADMFSSGDVPPPEVLLPFLRSMTATARLAWSPYLHNPKLRSRLPRVTAPTLVIHGQSDGLIPLAHSEAYVEGIRGASL